MDQEQIADDGGELRRKALVRLAAAAAVTALALAGLWWLERGGGQAPKAVVRTPAPILPAPAPTTPAAAAAADVPPGPVEPGLSPTIDTPRSPPPPPRVGAIASLPVEPAVTPRANAVATAAAPAAATGYVVQLGVFGNLANAQALVARLDHAGIAVHTETRVHIGPFANRKEAERARAELDRLGISGLIEPLAATK